jgi:translocation and assembly module TamB
VALVAPRSRIDGALSIDLERTLVDGTVRGRVQDLAGLAPLLPLPLQGAVDLDASLSPVDAKQDVQVSLAVRDLVGDFGRLGRLEASAKVTDALGARNLDASASARDFRQNDVQVARLELNVAGTPEQLTLRSTVEGEVVEPFDLDDRAVVSQGDVLRVRLEELSGRVAGKPLRLAKAAEATVGDQELRLSGLDLRFAGASLSADASMVAGQVTADAALRDLSLAVLADFGAPDLTGDAGARLQMRGSVGDPQATLDLTIAGLRAADPAFADLPPAQLTAAAKLASRRLRLDARGEGVTDKPLVLSAELPAVLQLEPFRFEMPDGPMTGRLDAEVQLARIADVAGLDDDRLEGLLAAALSLAGTVQEPQLNGTVDIIDGIYENGLTGTVLHDMTLHARARQQRVTIEQLSANDGGTGRLSGQGFVDIDPEGSFPLDVRLSLNSAQLIQTNEATATISGDLLVDGAAKAANLRGKLTIDGAEIQLPDQVGPRVPTIEVEEVGLGSNDTQSNGAGGGAPFDLGLDVVVEVPGRVFVRGRGLESEWEGRLEAKGSASDPRLSGNLQIRRGYFDLLDRRFDLRRGVITFAGESPPNPQIDIEAVAQAVDITAIVRIGGDATKPTLALDSEPTLPQDEVLSRLLFNRAASGITPVQAIQLAAAVNRLRGGGPGVLDRLRGALGVDTLDVGGGDEGAAGTTVRAGKYVANGVYVEGETGTADQSSRARVEVEILPNLSLQADTGADANSGVGFKWQYDY